MGDPVVDVVPKKEASMPGWPGYTIYADLPTPRCLPWLRDTCSWGWTKPVDGSDFGFSSMAHTAAGFSP